MASCLSSSFSAGKAVVLLTALALPMLSPLSVQAQELAAVSQKLSATVNIPAGPLGQVLNTYGQQTKQTLIFPSELTEGLSSSGLNGTYTVQQALQVLLENTSIKFSVRGDTITLSDASVDILMFDAVRVSSATLQQTAYGPVDGYAAVRSATGTKTDTPIIETPASIQVISRELIEAQAALNLKDVYENVSGVQQAGNTRNTQSEVLPIIRGFESPSLLRNGLRATATGAVDLINIERVEVLKGPASILYGALQPGGVINYVTKRPQSESHSVLKQILGTDSLSRTSIDTTGAINSSSTWMYRLNAAYTDSDSFRDVVQLTRTSIAPSFLWAPSEQTELLLDFSYTKENQDYDSGIPMSVEGELLVSDSSFFGEPDLQGRNNEDYYASYQLTHQISSTWKVRNQLKFHRADNRNESLRIRSVRNNDTELSLRYQNEDRVEDETQFVIDATATFSTGDINHQLLVGTEFIKQKREWSRFRQNTPNALIINNPSVSFEPPANQIVSDEPSSTEWLSFYAQDQISMLKDESLKLLLGARFDDVVTDAQRTGITSIKIKDKAVTARAGLLYMLDEKKSVYLSASESFNPQRPGTVDRNGITLDPETGKQIEVGFKSTFFDEKLTSTVSVYRIEKDNVAVYDQAFFEATGLDAELPGVKQRSQGIEWDLTGQLTPQMQILANYSYTDTEVLENKENPSQVGERLGGVSRNLARVWLSYNFTGNLTGLNLSGGARYVGKTTAQFDNTPLDSYTTADMAISYQWGQIRVSLNADNMFNQQYIARAASASIAHPGAPRSVLLGLNYTF
jgi:iron complex outermembrane receptor protein